MEAQNAPGAADPGPGPSPRGSSQPQALPQPLYLKALTIPLLQPVQPGCFQPHGPLVTARSCVHLDGSSIPLILNPLVPPEGAEQPQPLLQKQLGQSLTLSIVSTLPVLSSPGSCVNASIGSPGKSKRSGKYICKHCGRDCLKPSVLEKHIRSHTGERPFPCTTCGIAFKTQSNLYKHRRTQTHVNNTRLPSDSDTSGGPEQNERSAESTTSPQDSKVLSSTGEDQGIHIKQPTSETSAATDTKKPHELSLPATSSSSAGDPEREPQSLSSPGTLPNGLCLRKKMQEQRTPTANKHIQLQRQQATSSEKQWDYKPLDCKLKKCESTDSGYLSRSDSTEQQMASSSPLHSLYEHSTELENETAFSSPRCASGSTAKPEAADKATASMLEKKRLEEHISKLISHNKSVVDDTQLDNVRPRKTVLSKQGSIDLPMPYTYKDSFHFDIRTCDVNRKKNLSLCSAKSTFAPLEKCKPMFFHSVPTQFSTTIDTVPVTRSNSLPVVEGARLLHDKLGCSKPLSLTKQSVNTGTAGLLPSNDLTANSVDFPNSHPRALVRQTAVDDLPLSNVADHPSLSEELKGTKKLGVGEVISAKNKKHNQRKLKMFSQEKWQMYGDETFKKIYQKMKSSQNAKKIKQRENKISDITSSTANSRESASSTEITEERDGRSSASDSPSSLVTAASTKGKSGTSADGNRVLLNVSSEEAADRASNLMETSHSVAAGAVTSPTSRELSGTDTEKCTAGSSTLLAPSSGELRLQNPECQLSSHGRNDDCFYGNHHGTKESGQHGLTPLWVHCNNRDAAGKSQPLPSERKKLKFEVEKTQNVISVSCPGPSSESVSKASLVGFLGSALRGIDSNSFALHNATDEDDKTHLVKTGAKVSLPSDNAVDRASDLSPLLPSEQEITPEIQWNLHTNWKTPGFCSPVNTETTAENTFCNQNFKQQDIAREAWKNKQNKNKLNYQRQTEEKWMSKSTCSTQTPKKKICFTSVYTSGFFISADIKDERKALHHLCSGSDSFVKTSVSSKGAEPAILGWDREGSPRILKDTPAPLQDLQHPQSSRDNPTYFCHSFGTFYCHTLSTHCKGLPVLPHNNRTSYPGSSPVPGSKSSFPSLSAEPRLTWCCLSRSLPLPSEHSAASALPSLHTWDREPSRECTLSKYDISIFKMRNISKTVAYGLTNTSLKTLVSSFSKGHQMAQLPSREDSHRANSSQHLLENRSHLQPSPYGRPHGTAASTFKKSPITLRSPEFKSYSATPPKTYKKRGLEMMRKQTRVEYDDTSSDDEDRLVIEI
uniref:Zinc finger protein 831 n=1 Tax=Catharus ustulatus TaxID=91951 RepID=A0A8C3UE39_CATUS